MNFPSKNRLFGWFLANRCSLFVMRSLPLPLATGRKFDICHHLITLLIIANSISSKNPKIFVPHQFSVKFMSKTVDKLKKIFFSSQKFVINAKMTKFCLENIFYCYFSYIFSFNFRFYKRFQLSVNELYAVGKLIFLALK